MPVDAAMKILQENRQMKPSSDPIIFGFQAEGKHIVYRIKDVIVKKPHRCSKCLLEFDEYWERFSSSYTAVLMQSLP